MNDRLQHDTAWMMTASLMESFAGLFRDEERRDAEALLYETIIAGLASYEIMKRRQEQRLNPSNN